VHVATKKEASLSGGSHSIKNSATSAYLISTRRSGKSGLSPAGASKMTTKENRSSMKNRIDVSVIIPAYNAAETILKSG
jgi:hypothetical protein